MMDAPAQRRVSFHTLGCRLNQAETALMAEKFRAKGYVLADHGTAVEVAVIHTCTVTDRADARCRHEIRKIRRRSPDALVCAVGCLSQSDPDQVAAVRGVDLVVGNEGKYDLADLLETHVRGGDPAIHVSRRPDGSTPDYPEAGYHIHTTRANIKVQDGCNFACSYCPLPRIRGRPRSRPLDDVLIEGRELVRRGHRELVVTGVNLGTYRHEAFRLSHLARALSEIPGVARVRISSIEPTTIEDELLEWMAASSGACRHLHVPLQSGDDGVLERMGRLYTTAEFTAFVEKAMDRVPGLGLGTDVIVGFPGETEAEYRNTRRLVSSLPFTYLHVFSYSDRRKTASAGYAGKVDRETVKARSTDLRALALEKKQAFFRSHLDREVEVLMESVDEDGLRKGLTSTYLRVGVVPAAAGENDRVRVRLTSVEKDFCGGEVVGVAEAGAGS